MMLCNDRILCRLFSLISIDQMFYCIHLTLTLMLKLIPAVVGWSVCSPASFGVFPIDISVAGASVALIV